MARLYGRPRGVEQFQNPYADEPGPLDMDPMGGSGLAAWAAPGGSFMPHDEREADVLGLLPAPELDDFQESEFEASPWERILETIGNSGALQHQPRGFGQSLAAGLTRSLGTQGQKVAQRRQKFEASTAARAKQRDEANLQATRDYRNQRAAAAREAGKTLATERGNKLKYEQSTVVLTPEMEQEIPALGRLKDSQGRVDKDLAAKFIETPAQKAALQRAEAQEARRTVAAEQSAAAAVRGAEANTRAAEQATFSNEATLVNDYNADPAVKDYLGVRTNLQTARSAAKLKSGFGDKAMIFAYMRGLEPGNPNAVREGENLDARRAAGLFERLKNLPNYYFSGNQLSDRGRRELLAQMESAQKSRRKPFEQSVNTIRTRANRVRVDPNQFQSYDEDNRPPLSNFDKD